MGPPKETSPPSLFGTDNTPNLEANVNEDVDNPTNSFSNEEEDGETIPQSSSLDPKFSVNPLTLTDKKIEIDSDNLTDEDNTLQRASSQVETYGNSYDQNEENGDETNLQSYSFQAKLSENLPAVPNEATSDDNSLQSSSLHTKSVENLLEVHDMGDDGSEMQRSSYVTKYFENLPTPQIAESKTIYSNFFEDKDEKCFFDRAKFIAICGEEFFEAPSQEPWPQDVKLFQPYEVEQVILPDNANCLAVQAYLKMCGLDFQTEQRHNAEYMSPSGRVPFIKCGAFVVSELDPIIAFINTKGISLTGQLDATQRADMRAYMSLANTVLANAELYVAWVDSTTARAVTRPRYGSVFPWPLNHIVAWQKGRQVRKRLAVLGWLQKSLQEVYGEVENCCNALSERLDKKEFFFGTRPTELDALVFGHLFTVLTTPLPSNQLAGIVRGYPALVELVKRIEREFFQREN